MSKRTPIRTADATVARVRACAELRAAWVEQLWRQGETSVDQSLAIPPGEVRRILAEPRTEAERYRKFLKEENPARLARAAAAATRALASCEYWVRLRQIFALSDHDSDLLCLAVGVELDPKLGRALAYIADDVRATQATVWMAAALFGWNSAAAGPMAELPRWRLAHPVAGDGLARAVAGWQADAAVVESIRAESWTEPATKDWTRLINAGEMSGVPVGYPALLEAMLGELGEAITGKQEWKLNPMLCGPHGSGRETLAAQFAAALGRPLLAVATPMIPGAPVPNGEGRTDGRVEGRIDGLIRAARQARASGAIIYWRDADGVTPQEWNELSAMGVRGLRGAETSSAKATHCYQLKPLSTSARLEIWSWCSREAPKAIVRTQRLTPGEIRMVANLETGADVHTALRRAAESHGELMQALPCPYVWDDLVVSPSLERALKEFESQVLLRWEVYEEWGFSRLVHLGQGISALFAGPSGTGKTMAAQVLARSLGLELYRVDLAGVVNKYIGETEKRLRDVFDAGERSGALLFFDEADALFGSRMQVKDSHDRFANIEIDYLLQRIEQFDGIAILATNRRNDLDAAFLRRLRFVIDFVSPGVKERLVLWEKSLPRFAPNGEQIRGEVDLAQLARDLDITGAQIKAIALGAAFLARSRGRPIEMEDVERAAQREYGKQGHLIHAPIGKVTALR
ncbi:MAG TPA: ATP-binding protein [Terracidiphilus sp.]|nr:ATP-binding protein [Terracidiphilus sp.]